MVQRDNRLIGNIYRVGQVMSTSPIFSTCTAYHRYTNDVVGLYIIAMPPSIQPALAQQILQPLTQRSTLKSTHVLRVHNFGIEGARVFIATDPPRGVTLRYVLDTDNIDLDRSLDLIQQLTRGVQAFHEKNLSALDLRPHLITIDTLSIVDRAQVDDIGLRTILTQLGHTHSQQSNDFGYLDPRYAPPEYINNEERGPWSDTYQLGLLFFELITGRPPFVGQTAAETGIMQSNESVPAMIQYNHETPANFQEVIEHALRKDPQQRYATAADLLRALLHLQVPAHTNWRQKTDPHQPGVGSTAEIPEITVDQTIVVAPAHGKSVEAAETSDEIYAYLCYEKDGVEIERFAMTKPICVVGRLDPKRNLSPDIDLTELDPKMTISRQHVRIRFEKTFFYVEDLKSHNKTRLGELTLVPFKPEIIQHGDILFVGRVRMKFEVPGRSQPYIFKERK